jgi:class 3 adenylate cyclase
MARLRRYVPGSIAEEIVGGGSLEEGEREVTVLFVDVRGYTGFAQDRAAPEIFASVNRYTRAVSEAVRGQGGSIVEFNGDGMMTVFGAPQALPQKERAAVLAAREIARAVAARERRYGRDVETVRVEVSRTVFSPTLEATRAPVRTLTVHVGPAAAAPGAPPVR